MTALEKFIEQIVLKRDKGSVYLVPAICDFQIDEALEEEKNQGQDLPLHDVSKRGSMIENYERGKYANEKAASEIKAFCAYVMHEDSDLHKDADEWIKDRLK